MATQWFCGHCLYGPMLIATTDHCVICFRRRDIYATYGQHDLSTIASTAPPNQLDPSCGRTRCIEGGPTMCQYKPESLAEMPPEDLTSAPLQWFCCSCKKSNVIADFYRADYQLQVAMGQSTLKRKSSVLYAITNPAQNASRRDRATNATCNCRLTFPSETLLRDWPMKIGYPCCDETQYLSKSAFFTHADFFPPHRFFFWSAFKWSFSSFLSFWAFLSIAYFFTLL